MKTLVITLRGDGESIARLVELLSRFVPEDGDLHEIGRLVKISAISGFTQWITHEVKQ